MPFNKHRVIVVGGGTSGALAALTASEGGALVSLFADRPVCRSFSSCDGFGIAAALDLKGEGDSAIEHARDTLSCGGFLAHEGPVRAMCHAAPAIANMFDRMGVPFERTSEGTIEQVRGAGSSKVRTVHAGASTSRHVIMALGGQLRRRAATEQIRLYEGWEFLSLIIDDGGACRGIVAANRRNMEIKAFAADAVVICTGGFAGLFGAASASPSRDGAGIAACYVQGVSLANPEFIELHPYSIACADKRIALCDDALQKGARISVPRDGKPWHFLEEWFPNEHAHLSRAAAVRALWKATREMEMGVDGSDAVHIDFSEADPEWLTRNMSRELDFYGRLAGFDPFKEPIKIVPAVYATMGGLWVDAKHATSVAGLFAAGGAAGMYHGASVLAGNELLSKAYGGMIAGESAASFAKNSGRGETPASLLEVAKAREEDENTHIAGRQGEENAHTIARELCEALMPAASAAKENGELSEGREKIAALLERLSRAPLADRKEWENGEVFFMRRLKHKLYLAEAVCAAAIARGESRGAFYKPKFAERDDKKWHTTTRVGFKDKGPKLDHSEKVEILDFKL